MGVDEFALTGDVVALRGAIVVSGTLICYCYLSKQIIYSSSFDSCRAAVLHL